MKASVSMWHLRVAPMWQQHAIRVTRLRRTLMVNIRQQIADSESRPNVEKRGCACRSRTMRGMLQAAVLASSRVEQRPAHLQVDALGVLDVVDDEARQRLAVADLQR